jgi:periplasmic protein TonB
VPLIAPLPPPAAPIVTQHLASIPTSRPELLLNTLIAPGHIPQTITHVVDTAPPGLVPGADIGAGSNQGATGAPWLSAATAPPVPQVRPVKPAGPLRVSAGVAAGQLLTPVHPQYPAIALASRTQGTVVVAAIIGTDGRIDSLRVVSGSPLLANAAVEAIRLARYRPWTLSGQPVEVETTINVVFTLGN